MISRYLPRHNWSSTIAKVHFSLFLGHVPISPTLASLNLVFLGHVQNLESELHLSIGEMRKPETFPS